MTEREQVSLEHGYVLHQRAYKNSSQLIDCLTEAHGLVTLVAQGSRRPKSGQRALLQPFFPLLLSWVRRGELGRLTQVELSHAAEAFSGRSLMAAYYLNELLLRLTVSGDPNPDIFSCYSRCLKDLHENMSAPRALRLFELRLLQALGYGLELDRDIDSGEPLHPGLTYQYVAERGPSAYPARDDAADLYSGRDLIALREQALDDEQSLSAARRLLTRQLTFYLGDRPLKTRKVLLEIVGRGLTL